MQTRRRHYQNRTILREYLAKINWDWLFFKGQLIFASIFLAGLILVILWFLN